MRDTIPHARGHVALAHKWHWNSAVFHSVSQVSAGVASAALFPTDSLRSVTQSQTRASSGRNSPVLFPQDASETCPLKHTETADHVTHVSS